MTRTFSEVAYTLLKVMLAAYDIVDDTYGTAIELPEPQTIELKLMADNDEIKAQGRLQHLLSVTTHAEFTTSFAGLPFDALAIIAGMSNSSSGTPPNGTRRANAGAGGAGLPYFGIAGQVSAEDGADVWVGLPVCMLDAVPSWKVEQNKFFIPSASGKAIQRQDYGKVLYLLGHQTATALIAGNFSDAFAWNT